MGGVAVVGGGVSGLVAALELAQAGVRVTLLEAGPRLGGKVFTEEVDGFLVEHGPDSVIAYRPAALDLMRDLGLGAQIMGAREPRTVLVRRHGRMLPLPEGMGMVLPTRLAPFLTTRLFTWPQKLRAGLDLVLPRSLGEDDVAIGAFLRRRLGPAVVTGLADPLLGGIYGASVAELSLDAVLPRLREYERSHRSLLVASLAEGRAARARARSGGAGGTPFRSLAGGMATLVGALADRLGALGAELRLGVGATGLRRAPSPRGGLELTLDDGARPVFDGVILAGGVAATARLLADAVPEAAELVGGVRLASTTAVTLGYREEAFAAPPVGHGYVEAGPAPSAVRAVTVASAKWAGRAPAGHVLLRAFAAAGRAADPLVGAAVEREVAAVLGIRGAPVLRHVARWERSMPVYTVGHPGRVAAVEAALGALPQVAVAGSALYGVGVPDCVTSGRRAARALLARLGGHALD